MRTTCCISGSRPVASRDESAASAARTPCTVYRRCRIRAVGTAPAGCPLSACPRSTVPKRKLTWQPHATLYRKPSSASAPPAAPPLCTANAVLARASAQAAQVRGATRRCSSLEPMHAWRSGVRMLTLARSSVPRTADSCSRAIELSCVPAQPHMPSSVAAIQKPTPSPPPLPFASPFAPPPLLLSAAPKLLLAGCWARMNWPAIAMMAKRTAVIAVGVRATPSAAKMSFAKVG
mmetsp:Transcript_28042/g.91414  ORF Transcript_28042/g.91414 Transcript_28042/m.91414 type:complete len:234 (-) Transcript_28042:228-929(-)